VRIGVLGTGAVGRTIGSRLVELGHDVVMGSRSATNENAVAWAGSHAERAAAGTFADAAAHAEQLLVNATGGVHSLAVLGSVPEGDLAGKVLLDVSNAIVAHGPLRLDPVLDDSVGERLQRAHRGLHVVKALNTMNCEIMVRPDLLPEPTYVFVAGDDAGAKVAVRSLLVDFGWPERSVHDLGGIEAARALETYLPFWLAVMQASGTAAFNIRVVGAGGPTR
jgi:predicted dinucleotide-binding enzyme